MNCPSRTDEPEGTGFNQNPSSLAAELTTRADLNGMANSRVLGRIAIAEIESVVEQPPDDAGKGLQPGHVVEDKSLEEVNPNEDDGDGSDGGGDGAVGERKGHRLTKHAKKLWEILLKFGKFVGPGFMVRNFMLPSPSGF